MRYRSELPQLGGGLFLTDGGIETTLIFHQGLDLPLFAAFDLLKNEEGTAALRRYYEPYGAEELDDLNRKAIELMVELRERYDTGEAPIVVSGCIGPQDDGYSPRRS